MFITAFYFKIIFPPFLMFNYPFWLLDWKLSRAKKLLTYYMSSLFVIVPSAVIKWSIKNQSIKKFPTSWTFRLIASFILILSLNLSILFVQVPSRNISCRSIYIWKSLSWIAITLKMRNRLIWNWWLHIYWISPCLYSTNCSLSVGSFSRIRMRCFRLPYIR